MSLFEELKRRNVFRVAAAYLVVGWLLTEVLTTLMPAFGAPEWMSKSVMLVFALGFLPAIVLSWVYEITPDGIKKEREYDRDRETISEKSGWLDFLTIGTVIAAIIFIAIFSSRSDDDLPLPLVSEASYASVAVLPFINISDNADNEYFSNGLTETLMHKLAQIPGLNVAARTSSFAFRNQNKTISEIAGALDVAHVLEGSVQRSGDRVRITAQLIRANDGFDVWSESYDRTLDDIFAIQDEIATKVGGALSASLLGAEADQASAQTMTSIPDAYDLYLMALQSRSTYSHSGLGAEERLLKGALTIDPGFLEAKTALASNYWHQVETGLMDRQDAYPNIDAITEQVLAIRPDDVESRALQIFTKADTEARATGPQAFFEATDELALIVAEAPREFLPRILLARLYMGTQKVEAAELMMLDALQHDPFNSRILFELGTVYMALEKWDEARDVLERSLEIEPAQPNALANLARISLQSGDALDYVRYFLRAIEVDPGDPELPGILAGVLYELGLIEEGDDFRDRALALAPTSEIAYQLEMLRAIKIGDEEGSIASARRAVEDNINDRRSSYAGAVQHLLRKAAARGRVDEEIAFLEANAPNILDMDDATAPPKYLNARFSAFDAWYVSLPRDEMLGRLSKLEQLTQSFGFKITDDPGTHVTVLALKGEVKEAIEIALNTFFTESVTTNLGWRRALSQAQYAEMLEDPRIQAAVQKWEDEEAALRDQVRSFLNDLTVST